MEEQFNAPKKKLMLPDFVFNLEREYMVFRYKTENGQRRADPLGEHYDGYGQIVLGADTLPLFYFTVNAMVEHFHFKVARLEQILDSNIRHCDKNDSSVITQ